MLLETGTEGFVRHPMQLARTYSDLQTTNIVLHIIAAAAGTGHRHWPHIIGIILVFLVLHEAQAAVKGTRLRASHFWFLQAGVASPQARLLGEPGNLVRESEPLRAQARLAKV